MQCSERFLAAAPQMRHTSFGRVVGDRVSSATLAMFLPFLISWRSSVGTRLLLKFAITQSGRRASRPKPSAEIGEFVVKVRLPARTYYRMSSSQAGRRGFESRLPLHKINNLQAAVSRLAPIGSI